MVVGDDEVDASLAEQQGHAMGADSAVAGEHQGRPILGRHLGHILMEPVPLLEPMGDMRLDRRSQADEGARQKGR